MAHSLTVDSYPSYLHVRVAGDNTPQDVRGYLDKVRQLCIEHQSAFLLIEENLQGPSLGTVSIFDIAARSTEATRLIRALAYVDTNPAHDPSAMHFAENVAVNRGLHVKVFGTVAEATQWIEATSRAAR